MDDKIYQIENKLEILEKKIKLLEEFITNNNNVQEKTNDILNLLTQRYTDLLPQINKNFDQVSNEAKDLGELQKLHTNILQQHTSFITQIFDTQNIYQERINKLETK